MDENDRTASSPGLRSELRAHTRALILKAALEEIEAHGLIGAKMGAIASRAGVSRATLYSHFPTKDDFMAEVARLTDSRARALLESHDWEGNIVRLVQQLADVLIESAESAQPGVRREYFSWLIRTPADPEFLANPISSYLTEQLEIAQKRGEVSSRIHASELAWKLTSALVGFIILDPRPKKVRRAAAHDVLELIVRADD